MTLSNSQEDYLKTIYILKNTEDEIRVTDISNKLEKSKASVNKAINNLKKDKLVEYEPYSAIRLTKLGEEEAIKLIEATDIIKLFLNNIIGVESSIAETEANKIKTNLSNETLNKLAKYTHKTLGLNSLDCGYDINNLRCIKCPRRN